MMQNHNTKHGHITKKKSKASTWVQVFIYPSLYPNTTQFFVRAVKHIHLMLYLQIKLYRDSSEFEFINDLVCLTYYSTKLTLVLTEFLTSEVWIKSLVWDRQWYEHAKYFIGDNKKPWDFLKDSFPPNPPQLKTKICSSRVEKSGTRNLEYKITFPFHAEMHTVTAHRFWNYFKYNKYEVV